MFDSIADRQIFLFAVFAKFWDATYCVRPTRSGFYQVSSGILSACAKPANQIVLLVEPSCKATLVATSHASQVNLCRRLRRVLLSAHLLWLCWTWMCLSQFWACASKSQKWSISCLPRSLFWPQIADTGLKRYYLGVRCSRDLVHRLW